MNLKGTFLKRIAYPENFNVLSTFMVKLRNLQIPVFGYKSYNIYIFNVSDLFSFSVAEKYFNLVSEVVASGTEFHPPNSYNTLAKKDDCNMSLKKAEQFLTQIVCTLGEFQSWGRNCQIETFDLTGFPISSSTVRLFGVLSRLPIPPDWPQITSEFYFCRI